MKKIYLSQGKFTLVDNKDYSWLSKHKWTYKKGYATRAIGGRKNQKLLYMHREILDTPVDLFTDHKDKNGLNNQRNNLRIVDKSQNMINSKISSRNTSGTKGVCIYISISKHRGKVYKYKYWRAQLTIYGKNIYIGNFKTKKMAIKKRKEAERKYWNESFIPA